MDRLGLGFDENVIEWKMEVEATMNYDSTVSNFEYLNIMVNVIF